MASSKERDAKGNAGNDDDRIENGVSDSGSASSGPERRDTHE